jgi:cytochrome c556
MKSQQRTRRAVVTVSLLSAIVAGTVNAATDEAAIEYRQKVLTAMGANFGAIADIFKNKLPYGKDRIAEHARLLKGNVGMISSAFKQEAATGKTDAKAAIWKESSKFEEKIKALETEVAAFEKIAASGSPQEIGGQLRKVGGTCKACHDDYRKPKEESYKQ